MFQARRISMKCRHRRGPHQTRIRRERLPEVFARAATARTTRRALRAATRRDGTARNRRLSAPRRQRQTGGAACARIPRRNSRRNVGADGRGQAFDLQRVQAPAVGAQDAKAQAFEHRSFPALWQAAKSAQHQSANRVEFVVLELRGEMRIEVGNLRLRLYAPAAAGLGDDVVFALVKVVFVVDVADDLLQNVFDRHESRYAAVFVDDDRDMVAIGAELAQKYVEALTLGHEHRGSQGVVEIESFGIGVVVEQFLGEQDADDIVLVLSNHGKARVPGLHHEGNELRRLVLDRYTVHLRTRDHDVANRRLG